jgi:hypothetical protein
MGLDCCEQLRYLFHKEFSGWYYSRYHLKETQIVGGVVLVQAQTWFLFLGTKWACFRQIR